MSKITIQKKENFTVLDNTLFKDDTLSWKAKGLLAYLLHLPNDWQIYLEDLKNRSTDGKESTRTAINELIEKGYIKRTRIHENGKFKRYDYMVFEKPNFQKSEIQNTEIQKSENQTLLSTEFKKELNIIKDIVDYLNIKAETNFKYSTKDTMKHINARINEGYTLEDFKTVIDKKVKDWKTDDKMNQYLRPVTLFGTKFESYLNEKKSLVKEKNTFTKDIAGYKLKSL